jgi:hypothetical protein
MAGTTNLVIMEEIAPTARVPLRRCDIATTSSSASARRFARRSPYETLPRGRQPQRPLSPAAEPVHQGQTCLALEAGEVL